MKPLVYSCSGSSSAAQMANYLAINLDRFNKAELSCIARVGGNAQVLGGLPPFGRQYDVSPHLTCTASLSSSFSLEPGLAVSLLSLHASRQTSLPEHKGLLLSGIIWVSLDTRCHSGHTQILSFKSLLSNLQRSLAIRYFNRYLKCPAFE